MTCRLASQLGVVLRSKAVAATSSARMPKKGAILCYASTFCLSPVVKRAAITWMLTQRLHFPLLKPLLPGQGNSGLRTALPGAVLPNTDPY